MDEEDEHSPSKVSIILNIWKLLMQKLKQASPRARRPKTILPTNRKVQTQTRRPLLIWTLFSATLKLMVWKMRKLKAYLRRSLTTFCRNLFERAEQKWRRIRASDSFQFSAQYKLIAILIYHIQGYWVGNIQRSPCSEAKVTCSDTSTAKGTNRKLLRPSTKTKRMPFLNFDFNDPKERCSGFYSTLRSPNKRISVKRSVLSSTAPVFTVANVGSVSMCTFQIFHSNVKIVQNERKRRIVIDSDEDDWLWSYSCQCSQLQT